VKKPRLAIRMMVRFSHCSKFDFFESLFYFYLSTRHLVLAGCGAVAQLGERLNGIQEVVGSIPIGSTN
jgi:hypothetical protein